MLLRRSSQERGECHAGRLTPVTDNISGFCGSLDWATWRRPSNEKQGEEGWVDILKNGAGYISDSTVVLKSQHEGDCKAECFGDCKFI